MPPVHLPVHPRAALLRCCLPRHPASTLTGTSAPARLSPSPWVSSHLIGCEVPCCWARRLLILASRAACGPRLPSFATTRTWRWDQHPPRRVAAFPCCAISRRALLHAEKHLWEPCAHLERSHLQDVMWPWVSPNTPFLFHLLPLCLPARLAVAGNNLNPHSPPPIVSASGPSAILHYAGQPSSHVISSHDGLADWLAGQMGVPRLSGILPCAAVHPPRHPPRQRVAGACLLLQLQQCPFLTASDCPLMHMAEP